MKFWKNKSRFILFFLVGVLSGNMFARDSAFALQDVRISGNRITKRAVFLREIPADIGDSVCCPAWFARTVYNRISGLGLFNLVRTKVVQDTLFIEVTEKYYIWPLPKLSWADRNFYIWWQSRDVDRLIYGATLYANNIGGLQHTAYLSVIRGYNHALEIGYSTPFQKPHTGWAFGGRAYLWTNHELWYKTVNNRLQFLRLEDRNIQKNSGVEIIEKRRVNYFQRVEFTQGFYQLRVDSAALIANPRYMFRDTAQNDFYGAVEFISDHRDQRHYPSNGYLFRIGVKLGYLQSATAKGLGTEPMMYHALTARISHFEPIAGKKDLVLVKSGAFRWMSGALPYNYMRQFGYGSDYVRGYEPYVSEGMGFILAKLGLRKALVQNKVLRLAKGKTLAAYKKVPVSIWFNIFVDAGHIIQPEYSLSNNLSSIWQYGTGIGLDFVAWYNALLRAEYSLNRMGEGYFNISYKNAF